MADERERDRVMTCAAALASLAEAMMPAIGAAVGEGASFASRAVAGHMSEVPAAALDGLDGARI